MKNTEGLLWSSSVLVKMLFSNVWYGISVHDKMIDIWQSGLMVIIEAGSYSGKAHSGLYIPLCNDSVLLYFLMT